MLTKYMYYPSMVQPPHQFIDNLRYMTACSRCQKDFIGIGQHPQCPDCGKRAAPPWRYGSRLYTVDAIGTSWTQVIAEYDLGLVVTQLDTFLVNLYTSEDEDTHDTERVIVTKRLDVACGYTIMGFVPPVELLLSLGGYWQAYATPCHSPALDGLFEAARLLSERVTEISNTLYTTAERLDTLRIPSKA
jgi:hypothetical protein